MPKANSRLRAVETISDIRRLISGLGFAPCSLRRASPRRRSRPGKFRGIGICELARRPILDGSIRPGPA